MAHIPAMCKNQCYVLFSDTQIEESNLPTFDVPLMIMNCPLGEKTFQRLFTSKNHSVLDKMSDLRYVLA